MSAVAAIAHPSEKSRSVIRRTTAIIAKAKNAEASHRDRLVDIGRGDQLAGRQGS